LQITPYKPYERRSKTYKILSDFENKSLLIVDDDNPFRERLARAMEKKGFEVFQAESVQKGVESVKSKKPGFAVVDLRLADGNGLEVVKEIQSSNSDSRIIMLTGYGNIPTAVAAIKEGAIDYLAKPADAEDVEKALLADPSKKAAPPENPMSADRVKWEHIHRVLNYVIEMFQKQQEDLKCTEELFKEFFLKDHLDKFFNFNYLLS
jgi:two-component system response regulator RegA